VSFVCATDSKLRPKYVSFVKPREMYTPLPRRIYIFYIYIDKLYVVGWWRTRHIGQRSRNLCVVDLLVFVARRTLFRRIWRGTKTILRIDNKNITDFSTSWLGDIVFHRWTDGADFLLWTIVGRHRWPYKSDYIVKNTYKYAEYFERYVSVEGPFFLIFDFARVTFRRIRNGSTTTLSEISSRQFDFR